MDRDKAQGPGPRAHLGSNKDGERAAREAGGNVNAQMLERVLERMTHVCEVPGTDLT